ncbi:MAG: four helix bundle protein [Candidatus Brocadiae bacterium]|nr:four helix bundle protein [Candidatus Brocadiia bacterium]
MAQSEHLPIYKAAFDLLLNIEKIAAKFSRSNKFIYGTDLRNKAKDVIMLIVRANNVLNKCPILEEMRIQLEELKVIVRICMEIKAFPNFNSFEILINQIVEIAKQNEGWIRSLSKRSGQNYQPMHPKG